ncbi:MULTISPECIES: hypothetical protein [Actinomycetes]|uniref:hypothetical protein n=1 Tax=Actinomycetes TaxID=1760 RepID=UPI0001DEE8CE|nr:MULTISPECIES: hypothetical protein [Actinomycetes]EFL12418.1 predicted protein [Streptomyces sp. AA4]
MSEPGGRAHEERDRRSATRSALRAVEREARILRRRGWAPRDHPRVVPALLEHACRTHRQLLAAAADLAAAWLEGGSVPQTALARYGELVACSRSIRPFLVTGSAQIWHLLYRVGRLVRREPAWARPDGADPCPERPRRRPPHGRAAVVRPQHAGERPRSLIAPHLCTKVSAMPKPGGAKQRPFGQKTRMERPSVDARLHAAMRVAAVQRGEAGTLAYEHIVKAGLKAVGLGNVAKQALESGPVVTKEDMARLERALFARLGLSPRTAKQHPLGLSIRMERPSVDARLHAAMRVAAVQRGEAGTLAYEHIVKAGLKAVGLGDLADYAFAFGTVKTRDDMEKLELALLSMIGLAEEEQMAS